MKLKVIHKLFLALLLSTSCALITMAWLAQRSLDRGFIEYINEKESERLNALTGALEAEYRNHRWQRISHNNDRVWLELTSAGEQRRRPPPLRDERPPRRHSDDYGRRDDRGDRGDRDDRHRNERRPAPDGSDREKPPRRSRPPPPRRGGDPFQIGSRITLFDAAKQRVIGRAEFIEVTQPKALLVNGETVGWLGIRPLKNAMESSDIDFLAAQSRALFLFACALIILVALLALFLARHLVKPIRSLAVASRHLSAGDYKTRVDVKGHDEIAELARDFNELAHTLENNRQSRQRWVADISHELRTPLAVMRSELEALEDGIRPLDQNAIHSLHAEVLRINKLVHDLHELSLSDIGALTYKKKRLDLHDVLQDTINAFDARLQRHQLSLDYQPGKTSELPVHGDRDRLLQLFANCLENSIRYTDAPGQIMISTTATADTVRIEMADSPPGVAADEYDKLFERLYRVESSRSRVSGGSGLGLAICKNIVDAHEGVIRAQASPLGGLSVIIELPLDPTMS